jgi:protein-tyrosine kinase
MSVSETSSTNTTALKNNDALMPDSVNTNQIAEMAEAPLLSAKELDQLKIIYPGLDDYKTLNAYRELRTNLFNKMQHNNFICMVTGISQQSGTSHVSMNLATSIALDQGKTALVIDCNIYKPRIASYLKEKPTLGLTNFLARDTDAITDIIYPSGIPRVRVIPVGNNTIHAAELFSSNKMQNFINSVKNRYPDRFIIIDTPPIGLYAETQILASICDTALLVVGYGQSNSSQVEAGIDALGKDKLAGVVLNNQ